jgi:hypothetical protein
MKNAPASPTSTLPRFAVDRDALRRFLVDTAGSDNAGALDDLTVCAWSSGSVDESVADLADELVETGVIVSPDGYELSYAAEDYFYEPLGQVVVETPDRTLRAGVGSTSGLVRDDIFSIGGIDGVGQVADGLVAEANRLLERDA